MSRWLSLLACVACGHATSTPAPARTDIADRFPLAKLDDRALCDHLLARHAEDYAVAVDAEPRMRRKVIVSDLHLGPGTSDPRFHGIEDFYADAEWPSFLAREAAKGPTDIIIDGDFVEFWQIATALHALPRPNDPKQPPKGAVLGADQAFAVTAIDLVIAAHPDVFRALGRFLDGGDHRVIIIAGNHDADLLWPKVQLQIARAIGPRDPSRLRFLDAVAYQHGGVYIAHGHEFDAANRFATQHAPFGRDRDGRCRLQTNWGEVFVDIFYTETERQIPFIDNLWPEKAGIVWALRDNPDTARDLGAAARAIELLRAAHGKGLNRDMAGAILQSTFGLPGKTRGPESPKEVLEHSLDRLTDGDASAEAIIVALADLATDPDLANVRTGLVAAAAALPDPRATLAAIRTIDPDGLARLQAKLFGDSMDTAARNVMRDRNVDIVVLGHTHSVGGFVHPLSRHDGKPGYYANTGSWISVASVADLRAKGVTWDKLSIADRTMFPSKMTAITIEYDGSTPRPPAVNNAASPSAP
jgi:UDP-2,3-diacylglucosamine pyrophosphatase LpxH